MAVDPSSVQETIRAALILVGAIAQDEQPTDSEAQDALNRLKNMLDSWSADEIDIFTVQRSVWQLGTKQVYTAGPGGDWDMPYAPPKVVTAYCQIQNTNPTSEIPMQVLTPDEWAKIPVKQTTSPIPMALWCDYQWPLSNISVYPVPTGSNAVVLYLWQQLLNFSGLTDKIVFPPGYALAIIYNLAVVMAPFYGQVISQDIKDLAVTTKNKVVRKNLPTYFLDCDAAVQMRPAVFNWLTGEPV